MSSARRRRSRQSTEASATPEGVAASAVGITAAPGGPGGVRRDPRPLARAAAALALLWGIVFAPQLFAGKVFVLGDARVYRPYSDFSRERWTERHVRTYWNPYVMCGISASASLADMRPQYLPDAALDLAERLRPPPFAPQAGPLLAHLLGMLSLATLAWLLWNLPTAALVWAGVAYGFTPILLVPFVFGHDAFFAACSLMPVELLAVFAVFAASGRLRIVGATLALALVEGVQALTGHPQIVIYSGMLALAFAIERAVRLRRPARIGLTLMAFAWGAAISAAVWGPALYYGEQSNRGGAGVSLATVRGLSISWYELLTLAWPQAIGGSGYNYWGGFPTTDYPRFLGTLVMVFAVLAAFGRRRPRPQSAGFLLGVTLVPIAFALGPRLGPIYSQVFRALPFFSKFKTTSMSLIVASLGAALLSAAALARVDDEPVATGRRPWGIRSSSTWVVIVLVAAAVAVGYGLHSGGLDALYIGLATAARPDVGSDAALRAGRIAGGDLMWRALLLSAGLALLALWRRGPRARTFAGVGLVSLLLCDLIPVSRPTFLHGTGTLESLRHPEMPMLAQIGVQHPEARVLSLRTYDVSSWQVAGMRSPELRDNDWIRWHVHAYGGEHGTPSSKWGGLDILRSIDAMRSLGIAYISNLPGVPMDSSDMQPVAFGQHEIVYRLRDALARIYAVPRVIEAGNDSLEYAHVLAPGFDPAREAVTTEGGIAGSYPGSHGCRIGTLRDEPDTLAFEASAPAPAFIVVADSFFPGWKATLDGHAVPIRRVNHALRGIVMPAGEHRLLMTFEPEGWAATVPVTRWALAIWLVAACGVGIAFATQSLRRSREAGAAATTG